MADLPRVPPESDYSYQNEAGFDNSGKSGEARDDGKDAVFADILETLQENNFLLNEVEENLEEIEENTESDETASERRKRRVKEENTDKKGMFSSALGGLGAGIKGVGGILNKANPFQEGGLGTKMSILLISGVLFAISKFGDKLVKPLAEVLKMFDSEGSVFDKLKETELFKGVIEKFNLIKDYAKNELADDVANLLEAAMSVGSLIKSAYESITNYISQFDTRGAGPANSYGDGKLDALEMQNLKDDVVEKIGKFIAEIVNSVVSAIGLSMIAYFAIGGIGYQIIKGLAYRVAAGLGFGGKPSAEGPTKRSSRGGMIKKVLGTALAYGVSGSVGATAQATSLKPGERFNKVGSIIDKKGKIVKTAKNVSYLAKYPRLASALKIPFLGSIISGLLVRNTLNDDTLSKDEKTVAIGGHIGGGLTSAMFGAVGASLGLAFGPPGAIIGGILGSLAGFGAGDQMGQVLAGFLMGKTQEPLDIPLQSSSALGSTLNTSTGTVEGLPISKLTSTSTSSSGNMEIRNASTLGSTVSQLDSSLMNKNSDLAIAAYQADLQSKSALEFDQRLGQKQRDAKGADVVVMPQIIDQSEIKTFNSNYSSSLGSSNLFSTVRVLNLDGVSF